MGDKLLDGGTVAHICGKTGTLQVFLFKFGFKFKQPFSILISCCNKHPAFSKRQGHFFADSLRSPSHQSNLAFHSYHFLSKKRQRPSLKKSLPAKILIDNDNHYRLKI
ncbi:hypothetical protein CHCC20375_2726 [Bacillus licheniformis]|nr:hypothetical protein CHCC20375_2726 [Bacillus licheniformis]